MRACLIICVALLGCDDRTTIDPPIEQQRVVDRVVPVPEVMRIDILVVIDRSAALAPYRDELSRELASAGTGLSSLPGYADLHIGVVTADLGDARETSVPVPGQCAGWGDGGALLRSSLVDGPFISLRQTPAALHTNVHGSLASALPALADLDAVGCDRAQPLEAMRIALDANPHNAGFARSDAKLFVIFISAQHDESPRTLDAYAAFLRGVKPDPDDLFLFATTGDPRVRAFTNLFPNRGQIVPLAEPDLDDQLGDPYDVLHPFGPPIGSPCFDAELLDVDPDTDGVQPDCVVSERTPRAERLLPQCADGGLPCWQVEENTQHCAGLQYLELVIQRGDLEPPDHGTVEAECIAR